MVRMRMARSRAGGARSASSTTDEPKAWVAVRTPRHWGWQNWTTRSPFGINPSASSTGGPVLMRRHTRTTIGRGGRDRENTGKRPLMQCSHVAEAPARTALQWLLVSSTVPTVEPPFGPVLSLEFPLTTPVRVYDSDELRKPLISEFRNLWQFRGLLRLLVTRDLTVRYKRSALGVWWTLLNPLLTMAVLYVVFSQIFRFQIPGVPFAVYLLSGILIITLFAQGVNSTGAAMVNNAGVLSKVYVPAEVFAFSSGVAAAANFVISLLPLFAIQLITGVGVPWTALLIPLPLIMLLAFTIGVGLLVAAAAVYFYDVLDLTNVFLQLVSYLVPTFYPIDMIPPRFLPIVQINPLYSYLKVFRGFVYEGTFAPGWNFVMIAVSSVVMLGLGVWVFSRSWKNLVVLL